MAINFFFEKPSLFDRQEIIGAVSKQKQYKQQHEDKHQVSVVLPLHQPKEGWAEQFVANMERLNTLMPDVSFTYVVVHDGPVCSSLQNVFECITDAYPSVRFHFYRNNRGKGYALRYGVARTNNSPYTLLMDFDFPYQLQNVASVVAALVEGYDVVTGKRTRNYFTHLPLKRKIISRTYAFCNRLFFDLSVADTQSGLKGFNRKGKEIFLQTEVDRFLVDTEFLLRAAKNRARVKVVTLQLRPGISFSNFGYNVLKTELRNFISLVRLQYRLKGVTTSDKYDYFPAGRVAVINPLD